MDDLEHLPPNVVALVIRIRKKFGTPPMGWRYPTYKEAMEEDRELEARREISTWFRKLEADYWKINGTSIGTLSEN
ncbi:hypothetical protein [Ralstonia sp. RL]|uniref:hypothetical protein n=1 Tax=Ralstonia sp. RL TaxID=1839756 RepID=UPI002580DD62|nr:hypothetical protein [Ralstonia sp. RL]